MREWIATVALAVSVAVIGFAVIAATGASVRGEEMEQEGPLERYALAQLRAACALYAEFGGSCTSTLVERVDVGNRVPAPTARQRRYNNNLAFADGVLQGRQMSEQSAQDTQGGVTGETVLEAQFDRKIGPHTRWIVSGWLVVSVVGIPLIPFWLLFSLWYVPEFLRRISARLTTQALEVRKGVFFRSEATIPLNRITDVRLHDGPLMRHYGLRGLKVETAGQSGDTGSEGNIIGVIDAVEFRNAVLRQRQEALGSEQGSGSRNTAAGAAELLTEIRDILARIEAMGRDR